MDMAEQLAKRFFELYCEEEGGRSEIWAVLSDNARQHWFEDIRRAMVAIDDVFDGAESRHFTRQVRAECGAHISRLSGAIARRDGVE